MLDANGVAQYPWNHGETLTAAALNAAIANAANDAPGAPFLSLSGGTVTGPTTFTGGNNASGPFVFAHQSVSGAVPSGQMANWYAFNIDNDSANASAAQGGGAHGTYFGHNIAAGAQGGRTALSVLLTQSGNTTSASGTYYVAMGAFSQSNYTAGGTSGSPQGALFGFNCGATVGTGSGYWTSAVGAEIDVCVQAGQSVAYKSGLSIVQYNNDAVRGSVDDYAIGVGMQGFAPTAPGWTTGLQFGGATGWWPFTANSTMIGTKASNITGGPAMQALNGIDLSAVSFSGNAFMSNNFHVAFNGRVHTDNGYDTGAHLASGPTDLSHHVDLYNTQYGFSVTADSNLNYVAAGGVHEFIVAGNVVGSIGASGIMTGPAGSPTWTSGSAVPSATAPVGSLYSRVGGAVGATLYVSRGAGTWAAVAGV